MWSQLRRIVSNNSYGKIMRPFKCNDFFLWEYTQRVFAGLLIFPAFAIFAPFALIIFINSPGSVIIKQMREGKKGTVFNMLKLRTMTLDAEKRLQKYLKENSSANLEWATYGRLAEDPRIVGRIAKFARRFSIDELPQLLNVVKGEMSIVGPRPLPPEIAKSIPYSALEIRRKVLPGITGLWQVSGRSELTITEIGRLDSMYVENKSVANDIKILFHTVGAVISGKGAY